ncbi:MAG: DUF547 domain-containing protein [Chloroflexota bacterium]
MDQRPALVPHDAARALLAAALRGVDDGGPRATLAGMDARALAAALPADADRLAFWMNVYNAAVRIRLAHDPALYRRRLRFFSSTAIVVAGRSLSPNAIEMGILRRSAFVAGFGYVRNPLPGRFERLQRVRRVDPRIHFALDCGARSCPPVRAWDPATLDADLDAATGAYLRATTGMDTDGRTLVVSPLLLWYRGDFGGRAGVVTLLRRHRLLADGPRPRIRHGAYDWTLDLGTDAGGD